MGLPAIQIQDLVQASIYDSEEEAMREALRHLLLDRPELRIQVAVYRYRTDEALSLAQAAAIAGVSAANATKFERMKAILERHSVPLRLGSASVEEARAEVKALASWFDADSTADLDSIKRTKEKHNE